MTVHNFAADLDRENVEAQAPYWEHLYRQWFPDLIHMTIAPRGSLAQKQGIDRTLTLLDGTSVRTQEKIRYTARSDFLLEVDSGHGTGCMLDLCQADFLCYLVKPNAIAYLWPVAALRKEWGIHGPAWLKQYPTRRANNVTYSSINLAIPLSALPAPKVARLLRCEMRAPRR